MRPEIFRIWTHPHTNGAESLASLERWPYYRIAQANEWLDAMEEADEKRARLKG